MGQKNKITRRWTKRGTRPSAPKDQRTQSTYIFGAICPAEGKGAGLVLPRCTTRAMALHLAEIAQAVAPRAHAVVLLDRAGWHVSTQLAVPANITLVPLPAQAPELVWGLSCQALDIATPRILGHRARPGRAWRGADLRGARSGAGPAPRDLVSGGSRGSGP